METQILKYHWSKPLIQKITQIFCQLCFTCYCLLVQTGHSKFSSGERTVLWQYPKCAKEEEITQQAWSTDLYFILKSTTVCGYNFRYCTVTITECRSTTFTPHFCHGRHTGGMTSSSYWFAHLYHYFTHHINSPALEMRVHSKSC